MPNTLVTGLMKVRLGFAGKIYRLQIWSLDCRLMASKSQQKRAENIKF
jgi:hypothetical protein